MNKHNSLRLNSLRHNSLRHNSLSLKSETVMPSYKAYIVNLIKNTKLN